MKEIDLNKIDLYDTRDQEYYTQKRIVIPKGTRLENWSNEQKNDCNRFEMTIGIGKNGVIPFRIHASELEELIKCEPSFFGVE